MKGREKEVGYLFFTLKLKLSSHPYFSPKSIYHIQFAIAGNPYNLIGSQQSI